MCCQWQLRLIVGQSRSWSRPQTQPSRAAGVGAAILPGYCLTASPIWLRAIMHHVHTKRRAWPSGDCQSFGTGGRVRSRALLHFARNAVQSSARHNRFVLARDSTRWATFTSARVFPSKPKRSYSLSLLRVSHVISRVVRCTRSELLTPDAPYSNRRI